ncbi:DNA repair protein Rad52/59/22 [uncultured Caudovirales phage]|uniref:DNA repair protein Rad52/59/22 n=1 Tax=uncultured Caudovirales phage TaxID=2100421 RepID=A0A6J5STW3_9CAUD|nr:DNA repair protein Rad52/59/22 [uncultured Caudovirales phage]
MADLALISPEDLSLVEVNSMNAHQLKLMLKTTPKQYIHKRPAKGGGEWEYVTGGYVKKVLNLMFGWDWDFEIISESVEDGEAIVKGKLTCRTNGKQIVKMQFGNKDVMYKKQTDAEKAAGVPKVPLSRGNDLKAAATDCLKKCAAEIGIAADIYNKLDFKEVLVDADGPILLEDLRELLELKRDALSVPDLKDANRIVNNNEQNNFKKLHKKLIAL